MNHRPLPVSRPALLLCRSERTPRGLVGRVLSGARRAWLTVTGCVTRGVLTCENRVATGLVVPSGSLAGVELPCPGTHTQQVGVVPAERESEGEVLLDCSDVVGQADRGDAERLDWFRAGVDAATAAGQVGDVALHAPECAPWAGPRRWL